MFNRKINITQCSESELITRCKKRQALAQKELVRRYSDLLMGVAIRYMREEADAQDALQDALIRIFKYLEKYEDKGQFKAWIKRIQTNVCLRRLEQKGTRLKTNTIYADRQPQAAIPASYSDLSCEEILGLLDKLPEQQRLVFNLSVVEGYSHKEIATLLHTTESTSRSNLTRARKALQSYILKKNKIAV